jgi:anti-sigma regulatory factor (Ser/Thr protein kinase)
MTEVFWPPSPLPGPDASGGRVGRWAPVHPADVTSSRLQLTAALHDGTRPPGAVEGAVERLVLAFEELASNAVRHGRAPVEVVVTTLADRAWLLAVSDAAGNLPPAPAIGRDAALGGLGLHLVAEITDAHGWTRTADGRKTVWARIDLDRSEGPAGGPGPIPAPRARW